MLLSNTYPLKKDQYSRARGGRSRLLSLGCSNCNYSFIIYQKDGPGPLKRLYFDRIFAPDQLVNSLATLSTLSCPKCLGLLGFPKIYEKENRPSFQLIPGSFKKSLYKPA